MAANEQDYYSARIPVPAAFEDVFSHFYFAENKTALALTKTLLPSYQTILIFSFGTAASLHTKNNTQIEIDKCLVLGPVKKAFDYTLQAGAEILVANFKADAFYRFFGKAVLEDFLPVTPDELLEENCFTNLWYALRKLSNPVERVNYILNFCQPYLRTRNSISERLVNFDSEVLNPIKSIAQETQQTERNVQLQHKKLLGYSAKEINRYQRFLKAIELIQAMAATTTKTDWFEVIDQCGYYDQSQLIHDFKHFINLSPRQFLQFQHEICDPTPA